MIMPPKGSKRVAYQRTTTFVGALENLYNLMAWKQRQTVLGVGQRKDLQLAAAAADPDDKKTLNDIADKAMEQAQSSAGATTGTALHSLTERIDRGDELGYVPTEYQADLRAYQQATTGIDWVGIEAFRVHDEWKVAGTADRIGYHNGRLRIFDIKTGSIDYPHKMAMQLAMYARSTPYDIATDKRGEPDPIDLNTGIIIHLPAGEGRCELHEVNIAKGWGACLIAKQVHTWRAEKDLLHRIGDDRIDTWQKSNHPIPVVEQVASSYITRIGLADNTNDLRDLWREATKYGYCTDDFRAAAQKRSQELTA
jgi:hypothetical protein